MGSEFEPPVPQQSQGRTATRRDIFAVAGATVVLAGIDPAGAAASISSAAASTDTTDVIIIGGGFCGLTAARELRNHGRTVRLLEARDRLGGRTFTSEFNGEVVDLGGTWVHWGQPNTWAEIQRYGVEIEETLGAIVDDMIYVDKQGKRGEAKASVMWPQFEASVAGLFPDAYGIMPRPAEPFADDKWVKADRFSLQDKLSGMSLTPEMRVFVETMFSVLGAAPASDVSWVDLMRMYALNGYNLTILNDSSTRYKIKGGTRTLLNAIAADAKANLVLSAVVKSVRQTANGVRVATTDGRNFAAKTAIVTIPLNVLKDVDFSPALLPAKLEVSRQTHCAHGLKMHIQLDKAYPAFSGWAAGDFPLNFLLWDGVSNGKTHLIAFGTRAAALDIKNVAAVQRAVRTFLPDAKVSAVLGHEWDSDPFSQGVWAMSRPGQMSRHLGQLQQSQGRVHFASGDWANAWRGYIDGAIEQGFIAARHANRQLSQT